MSTQFTIDVTCPQCGAKHPFTAHGNINTAIDPQLREAVRDGSVFRFTCPDCGYSGLISHDLIYHQSEDQIMIHLVHSDEVAFECYKTLTDPNVSDDFKELQNSGIMHRLVRSVNELLEKLAIFDAGMDDRLVEICKLFIYSELAPSLDKDYQELEMLFFTAPDGSHTLQVIGDGETLGSVDFDATLYEAVTTDFLPLLKPIREDTPVINSKWALNTVQSVTKK